jgi:hypothetical protein
MVAGMCDMVAAAFADGDDVKACAAMCCGTTAVAGFWSRASTFDVFAPGCLPQSPHPPSLITHVHAAGMARVTSPQSMLMPNQTPCLAAYTATPDTEPLPPAAPPPCRFRDGMLLNLNDSSYATLMDQLRLRNMSGTDDIHRISDETMLVVWNFEKKHLCGVLQKAGMLRRIDR